MVHNLIAEVGKGLLSGPWGSAKTFIALDLSGCVMTGEPFAGRKVMRRGGVLFIAHEGAFEIPIRLKGLVEGKAAGTAIMQAAAGERPVDPNDMPFAWIEECPRLVDRDAADTLVLTADGAGANCASATTCRWRSSSSTRWRLGPGSTTRIALQRRRRSWVRWRG
ncbi:AAA family ATPase [Methylobacterium sp. A49B]|uniref:AAA family ATPase n=1 Tax=Methylobacterium mesophilicum TaxID=39956 RepID=UPI0003A4ABB5|nr:AAA family ATPase [Methylobacterium mesophilicum]